MNTSLEGIRMDMKVMSIYDIYHMVTFGYLEINPDYARRFRWSDQFQQGLIQSVLDGFPIANIIVQEYELGHYRVIDGVQRLNTIINFLENQFSIFDSGNGRRYFSDMSILEQRKIQDYQLMMYVIRGESSEVAAQIFKRISSSTSHIAPQESRNFLYRNSGMPFVKKLASFPEFRQKLIGKEVKISYMQDEELVLRFLSCYYKGYQSYHGKMREFLDDTLSQYEQYRHLEKETERVFKQACINAYSIWEDAVFVVPESISGVEKRRINTALFDVIMYSCAHINCKYRYELKEGLEHLLTKNEDFRLSILGNANTSIKNVMNRFTIWMNYVEQVCK